jgi:membrane peptidoglycan carboxypeptidase
MNPSYGDSTNSTHGRARVPGSGGRHSGGSADSQYDADDVYQDPDWRPSRSAASAPSGRARVGRASVRSASGYDDDDYSGSRRRGSYDDSPYERSGELTGSGFRSGGSATGRVSVGGAAGRASVGGAAGRASVGGAAGRASVGGPNGRASVLSPPETTGAPGGPTRAKSPEEIAKARKARTRKARRRNLILSSIALIVMLSGLTVVGGTYYFNKVPLPADVALKQSTTVYYADGKTPMAKFGDRNRTIVTLKQISPWVPKAMVATEDNSFYSNSGVSIRGIVRSAWNNVRGGETQGGSTITQEYARQALDPDETNRTASLKIKEAVVAMKLDEKYSKSQIMEMYLNIVYFGRGAYGIEAAAQAFFKKSAIQLNAEESMVLAAAIKNPSGAFDPAKNPKAAQVRFMDYVRPNMVKMNYITQAQADAMKYPTDVVTPNAADESAAEFGKDTATGLIVHHVMDELSHLTKADGSKMFPDLEDGGYKIVTTIDKKMEDAAISSASHANKNSPLYGQPGNLQAALVSVQPKTGRVMAYYGGDRGDGLDYAGIFRDPILDPQADHSDPWHGTGHPAGSTFKIYTLAAALQAGISVDSYWNGPKTREFPKEDRTKAKLGAIKNSGASCPNGCPLWYALQQSMNTVFYAVGEKVGAAKVIDMAHAMGINWMWTPDSKKPTGDLTALTGSRPGEALSPSKFSTEVAIGQYPVTVQDQATAVAAIAGGGIAVKSHFVDKVLTGSTVVYQGLTSQTNLAKIGLSPEMVQDEQWSMQQVLAPDADNGDGGIALAGGRKAGGKTGTWQWKDTTYNAHAWFVGFTPGQLATAVWVGNKGNEEPIKTKGKKNIAGATVPGPIWKKFMDTALKSYPKVAMPDKVGVGDVTLGEAKSPPPAPPSSPPANNNGGNNNNNGGNNGNCAIPVLCNTPSPDPGNNGGGNNTTTQSPRH